MSLAYKYLSPFFSGLCMGSFSSNSVPRAPYFGVVTIQEKCSSFQGHFFKHSSKSIILIGIYF